MPKDFGQMMADRDWRSLNDIRKVACMRMGIGSVLPAFDTILPAQYNELIRRRSDGINGESRLLWAVLEDAITTYMANRSCSSPTQRRTFAEVERWFRPSRKQPKALFQFETVCELLQLDARRLLDNLESIDPARFTARHQRLQRTMGGRTSIGSTTTFRSQRGRSSRSIIPWITSDALMYGAARSASKRRRG